MKVRFEIDIDYPEIIEGFPNNKDEIFRGADGKTFLFRDKVTQQLNVACCDKGLSDTNTYAQFMLIQLPVNTRIIDGDTEPEMSDDDKIPALSETIINEVRAAQKALLEKIEGITGIPSSMGISESTVLEALRIVSKAKEV